MRGLLRGWAWVRIAAYTRVGTVVTRKGEANEHHTLSINRIIITTIFPALADRSEGNNNNNNNKFGPESNKFN